jgi:hypothetical protein
MHQCIKSHETEGLAKYTCNTIALKILVLLLIIKVYLQGKISKTLKAAL